MEKLLCCQTAVGFALRVASVARLCDQGTELSMKFAPQCSLESHGCSADNGRQARVLGDEPSKGPADQKVQK